MKKLKSILPLSLPFIIIAILGIYKVNLEAKTPPGKAIYENNCSRCHGEEAEGLRNLYPGILHYPLMQNNLSDWLCKIKYGIVSNDAAKKLLMPANDRLNESELRDLLNYVSVLKGENQIFTLQNIRDAKLECFD